LAVSRGAESVRSEVGSRNARGEWKPPYTVKYAPVFVWPPRPRQLLKWLLSYPGFLWPWNSVYLLITIATWVFFQPELSRCVSLRADWIGLIYLRNLALLWFITGGWHLLLYTLRLQGSDRKYDPRWQETNDPKFLFRNQVYDNILWSCLSGCTIWTGYEALYFWACAHHWIPAVDWRSHPIYCVS
jgi:hypothetical protein